MWELFAEGRTEPVTVAVDEGFDLSASVAHWDSAIVGGGGGVDGGLWLVDLRLVGGPRHVVDRS